MSMELVPGGRSVGVLSSFGKIGRYFEARQLQYFQGPGIT